MNIQLFSAPKFMVRKIFDFPHIAQQGQYVVMSWSASLSPRMLPRVCGARVGSLAHESKYPPIPLPDYLLPSVL